MNADERWDAIVVGSGPNGLAAAIDLGRAGRSVLVLEAADTVGGGTRSDELAPQVIRDICSAILPLAVGSPFFADIADALAREGVSFIHPEVCFTHPLDGGRAGVAWRDLERTAVELGADGDRYRRLISPFAEHWDQLAASVLAPLLRIPRHPVTLARYGLSGIRSAERLTRGFDGDEAAGLVAGCAAHAVMPLDAPFTAAFATLFMASAHANGWPLVEGGTGRLSEAMAALVAGSGGEVRTGVRVDSIDDLPPHGVVIFDTDAPQMGRIVGHHLPTRYRNRLARFRFGPGICKVDHVLSGPVPWADDHSSGAGTVHVGGTIAEIAAAESAVAAGHHPDRPFVLVAQQSRFDRTRAPDGIEVLWSYTHVPNGSNADRSEAIETQIERFAPGFRDLIVERQVTTAPAIAAYNANYVGGDMAGGSMAGMQLLARPRLWRPHETPNPKILLCSASAPPGAGVHGMGGRAAASAALGGLLRR